MGRRSTTPSSIEGSCHENPYYAETDILYIEIRNAPVAETRDLDENTFLDVDADGNIWAITVERASKSAGIPHFSYEQITA